MKEVDIIYDKNGKPLLRLLENGRIVNFNGESLGFIDHEDVYDYNGTHRGWYIDGIFRDHNGDSIGFGEEVTDPRHPPLPFKQMKPFSGFVEFEPFRPFQEFPPFKPFFTMSWSNYDPISIFMIQSE